MLDKIGHRLTNNMGTTAIHGNSKIMSVDFTGDTLIHGILYSPSRIFISGVSNYYITLIPVLQYLN